MKKITIKLFNEDIDIAFNMAVQIAYEELMSEPFDVTKLNSSVKSRAALYTAAIMANNPQSRIDADTIIHNASAKEINTIDATLAECMADFFGIPEVAESHVKPIESEEEEEEKSPN